SDEGITFDVRPEMKAKEITDATIAAMEGGSFDFGRINYANGDMVGHTGNFEAAIVAVEAVDREICRLMVAARATDTILLVTADHGNADSMFDGKPGDFPDWEKGGARPKAKTSHTLAPVPCYIFDPRGKPRRGIAAPKEAGLAN